MKKSCLKPEITSSTPTSTSISYAITTTAAGTTTSTSSSDNIITTMMIKTKIDDATERLPSGCYLSNRVLPAFRENALTICDYISSLRSEINPSDCSLSMFNNKSFKEITREDLLSFLDSFRKAESVGPLHKWIGTYNTYRIQ